MDGAFPSQDGRNFDSGSPGMNGGGRGRGRTGFRGTAENSKTKLCTRWLSGECRFGDRCNFAHGEHELRALPPRGGGYAGGGGRGGGRDGYGYGQQMGGYPQGGYGMDRPQGGMYDRPGMGMGGMGNIGGMGMGMPNMGMGMNMQEEAAWAAQGYPVPGPNGWTMYRAKDSNEPYFHNHNTNVTIWERPDDWPVMASAMGGMP